MLQKIEQIERVSRIDKWLSSPGLQSPALTSMKDIQGHLEKLQVQTAECEMIRDLATDPKKRELFTRLAEHFKTLAAELEGALLREDDAFPSRERQPLSDGKDVQERGRSFFALRRIVELFRGPAGPPERAP
ncbi:hypothetical protein [Bradyrhizobium sp. 141]|uniref:hypothetical protein n=1 Tax=Bradyrhizobium sp. 141 TaxID=2782617 RepID=UPI001FF8CCFA|nr:hypothetical protein [Bradyrhizobium sp. 141]MCK1718253.1 hypothetical protein [Bradyrhizobium sp. 141]